MTKQEFQQKVNMLLDYNPIPNFKGKHGRNRFWQLYTRYKRSIGTDEERIQNIIWENLDRI